MTTEPRKPDYFSDQYLSQLTAMITPNPVKLAIPCFECVPFNGPHTYSGNGTDTLEFALIKAKLARIEAEKKQRAFRDAVRFLALSEISQ